MPEKKTRTALQQHIQVSLNRSHLDIQISVDRNAIRRSMFFSFSIRRIRACIFFFPVTDCDSLFQMNLFKYCIMLSFHPRTQQLYTFGRSYAAFRFPNDGYTLYEMNYFILFIFLLLPCMLLNHNNRTMNISIIYQSNSPSIPLSPQIDNENEILFQMHIHAKRSINGESTHISFNSKYRLMTYDIFDIRHNA